MIGLSGARNCSWNLGKLPGKPSFRSEDTVKTLGVHGASASPLWRQIESALFLMVEPFVRPFP